MSYSGQVEQLLCIEVQQFNGKWIAEYLHVTSMPEQAVSYQNHSSPAKAVKLSDIKQ